MACIPCYQAFIDNVPTALLNEIYGNLDKHLLQPLDLFQSELDNAVDFLAKVDLDAATRLNDYVDSLNLEGQLATEIANQGINVGNCPQLQTLLSQVSLFTGLSSRLSAPLRIQVKNMQGLITDLSTTVSSMNILISQAAGLKC